MTGTSPDRAIVLGCFSDGLAVVLSPTSRGVDVLVLTHKDDEPGLASRCVSEWRRCPDPADPVALVDALLECAPEWRGALVYPTTDAYAAAVSEHAIRLTPHFHLGVAPWEKAGVFLEKDRTYRLATEIGVAHPRIAAPKSPAEFESLLHDLELPAMIKPVHSLPFATEFGAKLYVHDDADDLRATFRRVSATHDVFVSEVIPGSDHLTLETCQVYIDSTGEVIATFCCTKLRQTPPMYGVIRVGRSIEPNEELVGPTLELLRAVDYRGFASAEFKRDPRDRTLKLIEVNVRPLRMSQFSITCGVDFGWIMFEDLIHGRQHHVTAYDVGTYYIDVLADVTDTLRYHDRNLRRFLEPYLSRHPARPLFSWRDPKPFFREISRRGRRFLRKGRATRQAP